MTPLRVLRAGAVAAVFVLLFSTSMRLTLEREGETTPGMPWAAGALGVAFLVRAFFTEYTEGAGSKTQKDFLWGLGVGGLAACLLHVLPL